MPINGIRRMIHVLWVGGALQMHLGSSCLTGDDSWDKPQKET